MLVEFTYIIKYSITLPLTGRNKAKKIYEEEMKRGITERLITKVTMVGTAGSGKSTSLETLTGEEPLAEGERESTPLLKRPVQTEVVFVEGKEVRWRKKTADQKKQYIASILRARSQKLGQPASQPPTVVREKHNSPKAAESAASPQKSSPAATEEATASSTAATASGDQSSDTAPEVTVESLLESSEVEEEFISLINIPSHSLETVFTETCVYIVDSGGQPEFVDAMTVFLGRTSACILVIDLSQSLDHRPNIGYYRRGRAVSKPYRSTRTNEENLKLSMRTMHTFVSKTKGDPLKLLFLGTHRDKLHKCLSETVGDKNKRLKKLIPKKFASQVIWATTEKLIFEMNALKPDHLDKKTAERIRRYVLEQCRPIKVKLPVRWLAFEEKLRSIAERLGRMVMSRQECLKVAESLGLAENSFDLALDHLHEVSLVFYFRTILPKTVFVDPQVLLDKVSELVEFMFELREPEEEDESSDDTKPEEKHTPDVRKKTTEPLETPSDARNASERASDSASESSEVPSAAGEESSETSSDTAASTPEDPNIGEKEKGDHCSSSLVEPPSKRVCLTDLSAAGGDMPSVTYEELSEASSNSSSESESAMLSSSWDSMMSAAGEESSEPEDEDESSDDTKSDEKHTPDVGETTEPLETPSDASNASEPVLDSASESSEVPSAAGEESSEPEEEDESSDDTKPDEKHTPDVGETTEPLETPSDASNASEPVLDSASESSEVPSAAGEESSEPEEEDESSDDTKPDEKHTPDVGETTEPLETSSDASNASEPASDSASESSEVPSAAGEESSETSSDTTASTPEDPSPEKELSSGEAADMDLLPPGWQEFMKFGRITKKFLEDQRFNSHYKEGVFSCDDLIHLLEELLVFARLWNEEGPETWFMPSVLRHISASDMEKRCSSAGALVVDFPDGGPQSGVFCSLMSHVLSPENHSPYSWKLKLSSQEPSCLYRDCIQFEVPKYPGSVTFVDRYEYFQVHVFTSRTKEKELWGHVRKAVFGGIETVDETLGYSDNKPRPAIVCPRTHTDRPHPAYIQDKEWICTSDCDMFGDLTTKYLLTPCES